MEVIAFDFIVLLYSSLAILVPTEKNCGEVYAVLWTFFEVERMCARGVNSALSYLDENEEELLCLETSWHDIKSVL